MKKITPKEIVSVMNDWKTVLRESYLIRFGPGKGKIPRPIQREIKCIEEGIKIIEKQKRPGTHRGV